MSFTEEQRVILDLAAEEIEKPGMWVQGRIGLWELPGEPVCAYGAIHRVTHQLYEPYDALAVSSGIFWRAKKVLGTSIPDLNDDRSATAESMAEVLRGL